MYHKRRLHLNPPAQNPERWNQVNQRLDEVEREFNQLQGRLQEIRQQPAQETQPDNSFMEVLEARALQANLELWNVQNQNESALEEQENWFNMQLSSLGGQLDEQAAELLQQSTDYVDALLEQNQAQTTFQADELQRSLETIQQQQQDQLAFAGQTLEHAEACLQRMLEQFSGERLFGRAYPELSGALDQARSNLDHQFAEAALVSAQQTWQRLQALRSKLEKHIHLRQQTIARARRHAIRLLRTISQCRHVQPYDLEGNLLTVLVDVNFWSMGELKPMLGQVRTLLGQLDNPQAQPEPEETRQMEDWLSEAERALERTIERARMMVLSSQVRFNLAQMIHEALQTQGYELRKSGYECGDMRRAYRMALSHLDGLQVRVRLSQVPDNPLSHNLDLHTFYRSFISEHEFSRRNQEIQRALAEYGLNTGRINLPDRQDQPVRGPIPIPARLPASHEMPLTQ